MVVGDRCSEAVCATVTAVELFWIVTFVPRWLETYFAMLCVGRALDVGFVLG